MMEIVHVLVVVGNTYEFNRGERMRRGNAPSGLRQQLFTASSLCAAMARYPTGVLLLPQEPHEQWLAYVKSTYDIQPKVFFPPQPTPDLSRYLLTHVDFPVGLSASEIEAVPWGYTPSFAGACAQRGWSEPWRMAGDSGEFVGSIQQLDGKIGAHTFLVGVLEDTGSVIRRPPAIPIDMRDGHAYSRLEHAYRRWGQVVVKPNRSWGGRGSFSVLSQHDLREAAKAIARLESEPWHDGKFLVERLVGSIGDQASPTVDVAVGFDDRKHRTVVGQMLIRDYRCLGTQYDDSVVGTGVKTAIHELASACKEQLRRLGYVGWFDVDFLLAEDSIWVTEINVRMTGGTAPLMLMEVIYGDHWEGSRGLTTRDGMMCRREVEITSLLELATRQGRQQFGSSFRCYLLNLDYVEHNCLFSVMMTADRDVSLTGAAKLLEDVVQEHAR